MRNWLIVGIFSAIPYSLHAQLVVGRGPDSWHLADQAAASRNSSEASDAATAIGKLIAAHPAESELRIALVYAHQVMNERAHNGTELVLQVKNPALASAVKLFLSGQDDAGAEAYFAGLENAAPEDLESYYATVLPLVEATVIDTLSLTSHAAWIRSIWQAAANADATSISARMGTHFRRLNHVAQTYRGIRKRAATRVSYRQIDEPRHLEHLGLDDRGVMYLLNGAPNQKIGGGGGGSCLTSESWLYTNPAAHIIAHFAQLETANQYVLISDPQDLCPEGQARTDIIESLRTFDSKYERMLHYADIALPNVTKTNIDNSPETDRKPVGPEGGAFEQIRRELDVQVRKMAQFAVHPLSRRLN